MLNEIIAIIMGLIAGTFTGLFPGIHVNLISVFLISISPKLLNFTSPLALAIFIVSMTITHSFLDFIPSIFLGAPDEDSFLSILPGHELLKAGKGHEAVVLTLYGSLSSLLIILLFIPIFIFILPILYLSIIPLIPFLLIFISLFLIFREDNFISSIAIFILAGFLGLITFNLPIKEPLLPLLTGLFGSSALIVSLKNKSKNISKQRISKLKEIKLTKKQLSKSFFAAAISAPLCSFLPGIGSGHAATISSEIFEQDNRSFLFLVGAINTIVSALGFITVYSIGKTRSGTAVAIKEILKSISNYDLIVIIITIFVSSIFAFFIGIKISKFTAKFINKINYKTLSIITLSILLIVNLIFSNFLGLIVLITSTSLGIFAIMSNSRRINLMACLLIPSVSFYLAN
ncbi:MAG: tripartite tricarboxylate transporter permease [Nanoarchaeota archaeon]